MDPKTTTEEPLDDGAGLQTWVEDVARAEHCPVEVARHAILATTARVRAAARGH